MDRLQTEFTRLYFSHGPQPGRARALLLEVKAPGGWRQLSEVWKGVQSDLQLPAPAIAVSGSDGLQLWFSLAEPVGESGATAFLDGLRRRYLGGIPAALVRMATVQASADERSSQGVALPPCQVASDRWSVFVAHDLASLFEDERWLDQPADVDAQADLLSRIEVTKADAFAKAMALMGRKEAGGESTSERQRLVHQDPRAFLLDVMNDPSVAMALRIEAAKALLVNG